MAPAGTAAPSRTFELGNDLIIAVLALDDVKEQDVNAHVMAPATFDRLVENIKRRGALESLPYCAWPNREGEVELLSGHHRVRAGRVAGLTEAAFLIDVAPMTRARMIAKQLAHNFLVGSDDESVLRQLLNQIDDPEELIASGAPQDMLPTGDQDNLALFGPTVDFDWRTITFQVLPHQQAELETLVDRLKDRHDLVLATMPEQFETFVRAAAKVARIREIRSGGAAVAALTESALREIDAVAQEDEEKGRGAWVAHQKLLGRKGFPADAAKVVEQALAKAKQEGTISDRNPWQLVEYLCADYLARLD
jgi:hypothetical protein